MSNVKPDSSSSSDESLDLTSDKFNAIKALYSRKVKVPIPAAPALDNLAKYDSMARRFRGEIPDKKPETKDETDMDVDTAGPSHSQTSTDSKEVYQRFLPHQQMVPGRPKKVGSNLLTRMQAAALPLRRLRDAASGDPRCRVRVVTRDERGVHGRLEGYVVLFDKHWNLAMSDVTEIFYRSAPQRAKDYFQGDPKEVSALSERLADLGVSEPLRGRGRGRGLVKQERAATAPGTATATTRATTTATTTLPDPLELVPLQELAAGAPQSRAKGRGKRTHEELADWPPLPKVFYRAHGKRQECVRHVNQLLVRGEHVVYVQMLPLAQQDAERKVKTEAQAD